MLEGKKGEGETRMEAHGVREDISEVDINKFLYLIYVSLEGKVEGVGITIGFFCYSKW